MCDRCLLPTQPPGLFSGKANICKHLSHRIWWCVSISGVRNSFQDPGIVHGGHIPICRIMFLANRDREASGPLKGAAGTLGKMARTESQGGKLEEPLGK